MSSVPAVSPSYGSRSEESHLPVHAEPLQAASKSRRKSKRDLGPIYVNCSRCDVEFLSESAVYLPKWERKNMKCADCYWYQKSHIESVMFPEVPYFIPINFVQSNNVYWNAVPTVHCAAVNNNYGSNQGVFMPEPAGFLPQSGLNPMMGVDCKWNQRKIVHIEQEMVSETVDFVPDTFHEGCINVPKADLRFFCCQDCQKPIDTGRRLPASSFSQPNQGWDTRYHTRILRFDYESRVKERWSFNF